MESLNEQSPNRDRKKVAFLRQGAGIVQAWIASSDHCDSGHPIICLLTASKKPFDRY